MKNILFAAVAALTLAASTAAFAGESNNPAGVQTTSQPVVASVIASQANANAYPSFAGGEVSTSGRGGQKRVSSMTLPCC